MVKETGKRCFLVAMPMVGIHWDLWVPDGTRAERQDEVSALTLLASALGSSSL